jgi:hypothetical protein
LPRNDRLVAQIVGLERQVARGGHDSYGHPPGGHDDIANAVAGACQLAFSYNGFLTDFSWVSGPGKDEQRADWDRLKLHSYLRQFTPL